MKAIKYYLCAVMAGCMVASCIDRYTPDTEVNFTSRLVVDAFLAADDGVQEIVISQSSSLDDPKLIPVQGCDIIVEDLNGNRFQFLESEKKGHYLGTLEGASVAIGNSYRLRMKTPEGKEYLSRYEKLLPCPDVDLVYYGLETRATTNKDVTEKGLQFYIDFKGDDTYGRFYRWELIQTYEYHSTWPLDVWLDEDGYRHDLEDPDYSNFTCYKTDALKNIYVLSTEGFSQNSYTKYKLHFVPDQTQVLQHRYSLLTRQYSLTETAFNYWENLRKNNQENVDLFGKQPANVNGNIYNAEDTTDVALGYFGVSAVRSKRIMVTPVQGLSFDQVYHCSATPILGRLPEERPLYLVNGEATVPECIFCEMLGGTTSKPAYWDDK